MVTTDMLLTIFAVRGVGATANAHTRVASAQNSVALAQNQYGRAQAGSFAQGQALLRQQTAQNSLLVANRSAMAANLALLAAWAIGVGKVTQTYLDFGKEVMNVMSLTGTSARESVFAVMLGKAAGMSDITQMRELLKLNAAVFGAQGQSALARLGIAANPNATGLDLFFQVSDALKGMQDGLRKTQIMEEIFGQRAVAAMLPLLRMTKEQRMEIEMLSKQFDTKLLPSMQRIAFNLEMAKMKLFVAALPIMERLAIATEKFALWLGVAAEWFFKIDNIMGGALSWVTIFVGVLVVLGLIVNTMIRLNIIMILHRAILITVFLVQAAIAILTGRFGLVVAALALLGAGGLIVNQLINRSPGEDNAADKMDRAADKFEQVVNRMGDMFDDIKGRGIPNGLRGIDIPAIQRQLGLDAIG